MKAILLWAGIILSPAVLILTSCQQSVRTNASLSKEDKYLHKIDSLKELGYPMEDLHVHLKGGLTMEQAIQNSQRTGIKYGIAANCGIGFPIMSDSALMQYYHSLKGAPVYKAIQAEGREWIKLFSLDSVALFDYAFTDAMTFTDNKGRRTRLWMPGEVWVDDEEEFMETLVDRIVGIMENEPVQVYVNSTFLPEVLQERYHELWTTDRMDRVIQAAVTNNIAIEINARFRIPSREFILRAKKAGVLFTLGTNNSDANLGLLEYGIDMIEACGLKPDDFFQPSPKI